MSLLYNTFQDDTNSIYSIFLFLKWSEDLFTESPSGFHWRFKNKRLVLWTGGDGQVKCSHRSRKSGKTFLHGVLKSVMYKPGLSLESVIDVHV